MYKFFRSRWQPGRPSGCHSVNKLGQKEAGVETCYEGGGGGGGYWEVMKNWEEVEVTGRCGRIGRRRGYGRRGKTE